jgi:hypothetical protein
MSTLNVSNITDGTTTVATTYITGGSIKVWLNMTGTGTIAINDSLNVSSATDIGTGNYRIYYTSNMADVNYSVGTSGAAPTAGSGQSGKQIGSYVEFNLVNSAGVSSFNSSGTAYEDPTRVMLQNAGDLA